MNAIEVYGLARNFGELTAVRDVTFDVHQGEIFGFLGPNGAGKTTTINILCTLLRPTSGRAIVNGFDVALQRSEVRKSIGLVFQDPSLDEYLSAEQNLKFHALAYNVPNAKQRIGDMLKLVDLWERRRDSVYTFSGGMKRRLEIARGLLHHPKVLFLDEPTLGLDPQTRGSVWHHILEMQKREEATIFLTTHYMDEAEHCDRIAIIDYGSIVALDTPDMLKTMVGGDVVVLEVPDTQAAARELAERYHLVPRADGGMLQFEIEQGSRFIPDFVRGFSQEIQAISLHRPTLDDAFLKLTGRDIRDEEGGVKDMIRAHVKAWTRSRR